MQSAPYPLPKKYNIALVILTIILTIIILYMVIFIALAIDSEVNIMGTNYHASVTNVNDFIVDYQLVTYVDGKEIILKDGYLLGHESLDIYVDLPQGINTVIFSTYDYGMSGYSGFIIHSQQSTFNVDGGGYYTSFAA